MKRNGLFKIISTLFASLALVMTGTSVVNNKTQQLVKAAETITLNYDSNFTPAISTSSKATLQEHTLGDFSFKEKNVYKANTFSYLMFAENKGFLYSTVDLGTIHSVAVTYSDGTSTSAKIGVYFSNKEVSTYTTTNNKTIAGKSKTDTFKNEISGNGFFQLSTNNKNCQITKIEISYTKQFETPMESYTATLHYNDGVTENSTIASSMETGLFTKPTNPTRDGYTFVNWYSDETLTNEYNFSATATSNIDLYARWTNDSCSSFVENFEETDIKAKLAYRYTSSTTDSYDAWSLVDDASTLEVNDKIVIVSASDNFAISTTQNNNNRGQAGIEKNSETNTLKPISDNVQIITLEKGKKEGTFAFNVGNGYLYAASSSKSNNYLKTQKGIDDNASWEITISENISTIKAQGANTNNLIQYNSNNDLFSCYKAAQGDVSIYKLTRGTEITGSKTDYSNVDFRIMFGIESSKLNLLPEKASVKINIQTKNANNSSYDLLHEKNGVKCIVFELGDLINNVSNVATKFVICLKVEFEGETYTTVTRSISVADLITAYYGNETTKEAVSSMYNYYEAQGCINAK